MKPRYAQNRECLKGYTTEKNAQDFRRLTRLKGMSISDHIRYLVDKEVAEYRASHSANVVQLEIFKKG